jgi:hypothetical protein
LFRRFVRLAARQFLARLVRRIQTYTEERSYPMNYATAEAITSEHAPNLMTR